MSENVQPLNFHSARLLANTAWAQELRDKLANNQIAALAIVGVDCEGNLIEHAIIPVHGPDNTLRYTIMGGMHDMIATFARAYVEDDDR